MLIIVCIRQNNKFELSQILQMKKNQKQKVILNNAYKEVSLIDEHAKTILHSCDGPKGFQGLFSSSMNRDQEGVQIQKQPLYFDQVDHNIEQVGIMAVKEVRYLTDQQWQAWVKGRENLMGLLQDPKTYKYESRHKLAIKRERDQKGKFLSKPKQKPKNQNNGKRKIKKKRGRKPKAVQEI